MLARVNILLVDASELDAKGARARLGGRRLEHVRDVQKRVVGDTLRVGQIDGDLGQGRILRIDDEILEVEIEWGGPPPPPLPAALAVALPRPPILRRVLYGAALLGIKEIHVVASARSHRSFWQSRSLRPEAIRDQLELGLEQARDTGLPRVQLHPHFRPFAENFLPGRLADCQGLVAQAGAPQTCPRGVRGPHFLLVGPEAGWNEFELAAIKVAGAQPVDLGERILRVDWAVAVLVARLF